jgi:hypothetical protein
MTASMQANQNDEKMYLVQKLLREGKAKFQVARAVGYQGVDGLDRYAKSIGYVWNLSTKNYELKDSAQPNNRENPTERILKIMSMVEKGLNLNDIAKYFRLPDAQALAEYMKGKGYLWDVEKNNYVKKSLIMADEPESKLVDPRMWIEDEDNEIDLMTLLESNKGRLKELLAYKTQRTIPRYLVKGIMVTKSFYLSIEIDKLLKDFSNRKDIPQKDIIQTALIKFFRKYGFDEEAGFLLKS